MSAMYVELGSVTLPPVLDTRGRPICVLKDTHVLSLDARLSAFVPLCSGFFSELTPAFK